MDEQLIPYILLAKCFSGQCTPAEQEEAERWRLAESDHALIYRQLQEQWERIHLDTSAYVVPDKATVWENIQREIHHKAKQIPLYTRSLLIRISGIAAALALIAGFSLSFLFNEGNENWMAGRSENVVIAPSGQKSQLILPDGTLVWLNSGSRLTYSYAFNTRDRVVNLEGEAFFDVTKDQQYPFVVKTGDVDVKVLGTAFNVQAYTDEADVTVALLRGKVSLLSAADQNLLTSLLPDQMATVSKNDLSYQVASCDASLESSWHQNLLKFDGTSAEEVWKKLERWYGVRITLSNAKPSNAYWFTVKTESLTELLEMINKITPIEYKLDGEEVTVRYK